MRIIVVGGGIMGLASAWALRRDGHEVTVLEQGPIPNPLGSSVDQHRVIRFTYGAMHGYARLVRDAYAAWDRVWDDLGVRHYRETGMLVVARDEGKWTTQSLQSLEALGVPVRRLEPAELLRRIPMVDVGDARFGLWTPTGGVLFAERIVRDLARLVRAQGGEVRTGARVVRVDLQAPAVELETGKLPADLVLITAGPWAPRLVPELAGRVTPSRQVVVYLEPPSDQLGAWRQAPILIDQIEMARGGFYAVPPVDGTGLKVGDHGFTLQGDPDEGREASAADIEAGLAFARSRLKDFERYRVTEAKTCFYSVTADERFIVEEHAGGMVLAGFSGHGFKFGALMGELVADVVAGRRRFEQARQLAAGEA